MSQMANTNEAVQEATLSDTTYHCVTCRSRLTPVTQGLQCASCHVTYPIEDGIPVFAKARGYWCNVSREKMRELINDAEQSNDWLSATNHHIPRYAAAVVPLYRADAQFVFPINSESRVLDAGSMWGGLTVPIAQYAKTVYAVDQTWETLRFLQVRAKQMGLNNIIPVESSIHQLPFPDNFFDFVVLNGVLEWLGMEQDVVLEKHWDQKRSDSHVYKASPEDMQLAALKELYRVVKPGGGIYIAIENRSGLQYFLGHPDDHMNVRFVTFLPRSWANFITKLKRNTDYRTYIYTPNKLKELVNRSGFQSKTIYSAYPHYGKMSRLVPFEIFGRLGSMVKEGYHHFKVFTLSFVWKLIPEPLSKYLSPSLALVAAKGEFALPQRLLQMLATQSLIDGRQFDRYQLALVNNRFGNGHTTNYLVYDKEKRETLYFCKISRDKQANALAHESQNLRQVMDKLKGSTLENSIPNMVYEGTVDGITIQVANYLPAKSVSSQLINAFRCLPRFIPFKWLSKPVAFIQAGGRSLWLKQIHPWMMQGINWLAEFQRLTKASSLQCSEMENWLSQKLTQLQQNKISVTQSQSAIEKLKQQCQALGNVAVPVVMAHGDFDVCNLINVKQKLMVVDFEHTEMQSLPFFDLANLIFSPLLTEWKVSGQAQSLADYAKVSGWQPYLKQWLQEYATKSGMDSRLVKLLPQIAAIEQNAKKYPDYRDPYDYPMFGQDSFDALMSWSLCNE